MSTFSIYQFISNHSKSISLIIILVLTIIITLHVYDSHSKKEGATGIGEILKMIQCPMTIFKNFNRCLGYWTQDLLFYVIWGLSYIPCYIVFLVWSGIYLILSNLLPISTQNFIRFIGCYPEKPNKKKMIPTKESVMNAHESFYRLFSDKKHLYRDNDDIKKCYCARPLRSALRPLTYYTPFTINSFVPSLGIYSVIIGIMMLILLVTLHLLSKGLQKAMRTGMNAINTFRQPKIAVGVPILDGVNTPKSKI
jgi:hypothetical protein